VANTNGFNASYAKIETQLAHQRTNVRVGTKHCRNHGALSQMRRMGDANVRAYIMAMLAQFGVDRIEVQPYEIS